MDLRFKTQHVCVLHSPDMLSILQFSTSWLKPEPIFNVALETPSWDYRFPLWLAMAGNMHTYSAVNHHNCWRNVQKNQGLPWGIHPKAKRQPRNWWNLKIWHTNSTSQFFTSIQWKFQDPKIEVQYVSSFMSYFVWIFLSPILDITHICWRWNIKYMLDV